jgi:hypothetical protein
VSPQCGPPDFSSERPAPIQLTVTGRNFTPGQTLRIDFDPQASTEAPPPVATVTVSDFGSFDQPISVVLPPRLGPFAVVATDTANSDFVVRTQFDAPCQARISVTPNCGPAVDPPTDEVYDVRVDGTDWGLGIDVTVRFEVNGQPLGEAVTATPDGAGAFSVPLRQSALPAGTYQVHATQPAIEGQGPEAFVDFFAPCPTPQLSIDPDCAPAGSPPDRYQLSASGSDFIPRRRIELIFDSGPNTQIFVYDKDGTETGTLEPVPIDPFQRPPGTYDVMARQYSGSEVALETHASFQVPCAQPAITIDTPGCGPPQLLGDEPRRYDITLRGRDFVEGEVTIIFDPESTDPAFPPESFAAPVDGKGVFARAIDPLRRPAGTYRIVARQETRRGAIEKAVPFRAPCVDPRPTLQRDPVCDREAPGQPDAYSISLRLTGYIPGFVELIFDADGTREPESGTVGENGRLTVTITPSGRAAGTYRIVARQRDARRTLTEKSVTFAVPCITAATPTLRIEPASGAPGFVTFAIGSDFPPGTQVTLHWSRGIDAARGITVSVDASGAFRRPVLIFHHDFSGSREMTAGTAADPAAFPTAHDSFTVVAGQGSPQGVVIDPSTGQLGPPIVFRH